MDKPISRSRLLAAWGVALAADAVQVVLFPLFVGGAPEGPDLVVDVVAGGLLTWLCGWHWAFLPTFAIELFPVADFAPTWLAAMGWVSGRQFLFGKKGAGATPAATPAPEALPAAPPPKVTDIETK